MAAVSEDDQLDTEETRRVLRRAGRLALPFRRPMFAALGFVGITTLCTLLGPVILRYGIDNGIDAADRGVLRNAVLVYVGVVIVSYLSGRQQYIFVNRAGEGFLRALRIRLFDHIQKQSLAFYDRYPSGVLVSRMTADIESMAELVQWGLLQFISATLLIVLSFVLLFALSWELALIGLCVMPLIIVASRKFQRDSNAAYLDVRERVGENLATLQEGIAGVRVIQAYAQEDAKIEQFERSSRRLFASHVHSLRVSTWYFGYVEACGVVATALTVGVGGWLVSGGDLTVGTVIAGVLLLSQLFEPVQQLSQLYNSMQSSAASLTKLFAILDTEPDIVDGDRPLPRRGDLVVRDVGFAYPDPTHRQRSDDHMGAGEVIESASVANATADGLGPPVLSDVSLTIGDGERLALVGATGSGKSTLAKLMARLYDPTSGAISFAGIDLRDATIESLRERIVVVPQEGYLFGGTVADNVRVGRVDATDDDVRAALAELGALERFEAFEDGIHTEVRERGSRLSAGERQLVSLARAALVDPAVLVLDEATSNLDPGTEMVVEQALERLMTGRTTVVVAHRLSTVRRADRVAVVHDGRLVELGTHDELIAEGGRYAALADAWQRTQPA